MVFDNYTEGISVKEITHERKGGRLRKSDPVNLEDSTHADQGQDCVYRKECNKRLSRNLTQRLIENSTMKIVTATCMDELVHLK